ncbi:ABC transporter transmembrane domain-containing protein, partial [Enterococcus faecalis]|uniref:ABC transporter transmembrane domain-containing protein n=1 Tax=Enterococcus faecalis TaxID=1351 RepID=UPI003CC67551
QELSNKQSNLNAYIHESISGIKITKSFAREDENFQIFNEVSEEYRHSFMKAVSVQFLLWQAVQNISDITTSFNYF